MEYHGNCVFHECRKLRKKTLIALDKLKDFILELISTSIQFYLIDYVSFKN